MTVPSSLKLYVTDGAVSKVTALTITPVVKLSTVSINAVEGGFNTTGTIALNIPAQTGGAVVPLISSNPALVQVPATTTVLNGVSTSSFTAVTGGVTVATSVPVTATFNGTTATANVSLSAAPVVSITSVTATSVIGGQTLTGTVLLNNFVRDLAGGTITLFTGDSAIVQLPATIVIPKGSAVGSFSATTTAVSGSKSVSIRASYNGSQATITVAISPIPPIVILSAEYKPTLSMLKVDATTLYDNSTLTYGSNGVAFGTMQFEAGIYQGSIVLPAAPATVTVWSSVGGIATVPVVIAVSGGGGSGSTTTTYKINISTNGKGTVATNPTGTRFATGTVVTLTATPDAGAPWIGWSGSCTGTSRTCTLTMTSDKSVTANFR